MTEAGLIDKAKLREWFHEVYALYERLEAEAGDEVKYTEKDLVRKMREMTTAIGMEIKSGRFDHNPQGGRGDV